MLTQKYRTLTIKVDLGSRLFFCTVSVHRVSYNDLESQMFCCKCQSFGQKAVQAAALTF